MTEEINLDSNNFVEIDNNSSITNIINKSLNKLTIKEKSYDTDLTLFNYLYKNITCSFNTVNTGLYTFTTQLDNNNILTLTIQDLLNQGQFSNIEYINRLIGLSDGINYITILSIKNSNSENPYAIAP